MRWILLIAFVVILGIVTVKLLPDSKRDLAERVITQIRNYQFRNGYLPESLDQLGLVESNEGPVFYERVDRHNFIVYYGTSLGESEVYTSESGWN